MWQLYGGLASVPTVLAAEIFIFVNRTDEKRGGRPLREVLGSGVVRIGLVGWQPGPAFTEPPTLYFIIYISDIIYYHAVIKSKKAQQTTKMQPSTSPEQPTL